MNIGYLRRDNRHLSLQQRQLSAVLLIEGCQDTCNGIAQHLHDGEVVLDKTELGVQADIFTKVARGVVRLGPENRTDLKDPLEDADHDLLVKLRALRQVSGPPEVVELEDVGPALGSCRNDLRC